MKGLEKYSSVLASDFDSARESYILVGAVRREDMAATTPMADYEFVECPADCGFRDLRLAVRKHLARAADAAHADYDGSDV